MKRLVIFFLLSSVPLLCQSNQGELRLKVTDPAGLGLKSTVRIVNNATQYRNTLSTTREGGLEVERLAFGTYQIEIQHAGFATKTEIVEIRSSLPIALTIQLQIAPINQSVTVTAAGTLLDPHQAGSVSQISAQFIQDRLGSIPGRAVQDLVNSQPGWLYEGNAVLHPRGSEYQTQFVLDGIPLTDNRSPSFGPAIEADDVQSMTIYTAGIPAEYGRKMGGVVEVNTLQDSQSGFHGEVVLSGGSYDSGAAFGRGQYSWGKNTLGGSANGSMTDHYLNPVVPRNYSNTGTVGDFAANYARVLTSTDKVKFIVRREIARYDIPNELVQQAAGQRQTANNFENMGIVTYEHIFSANAIGDLRGMVRENANNFYSNPLSTPIEIFQNNWFREGYFNGNVTIDHGRHEFKAGVESDNICLNERMNYKITDPSQFDPGSPTTFAYQANRPDLEQSVYVQDLIHFSTWTINAGLRYDHYQLLLNKQALQPRLAISHYFKSADAVLHFSYDRVFQTPSFENILLTSSPAVESIDPTGFLRLPVQPSVGDYYEAGLAKVFFSHLKVGTNYYRRFVNNYADDSQIENTTISFPIAFRKSIIYGAEVRLDLQDWHKFSGFASYSYMVGNVWLPVTGGLFFGEDAQDAASQLSGHFPDSQDQRNTLRGRLRYQFNRRYWAAFGVQFDSGLPFDFDGDPATALAQYGQQVFDRLNFNRGRIDPAFQANASFGADILRSDRFDVRIQADGQNLNNVLNVIDFGGLFSGNAIGPSRSFTLRLATEF